MKISLFDLELILLLLNLIAFITSIETGASLLALAKSVLRLNEIKVEKWVSYSCLTKGAAYTIKSKGSYRKYMMQFLRYAGFWVPEANVKLASTLKSGQPKNSFESRTRSKQKRLKHKDVHRCEKQKHKQEIRHTGAKVSNFDDTGVDAIEFKTGIQSKIRQWWEKGSSITSAMVLTLVVHACFVPIYTYHVITH